MELDIRVFIFEQLIFLYILSRTCTYSYKYHSPLILLKLRDYSKLISCHNLVWELFFFSILPLILFSTSKCSSFLIAQTHQHQLPLLENSTSPLHLYILSCIYIDINTVALSSFLSWEITPIILSCFILIWGSHEWICDKK